MERTRGGTGYYPYRRALTPEFLLTPEPSERGLMVATVP